LVIDLKFKELLQFVQEYHLHFFIFYQVIIFTKIN
jgi:hypothetical protein